MADEIRFEKNDDYWKLNQGESFWEDALEHFLRERLDRIYKNKKLKKKLQKWLSNSESKSAVINLTDIPSDPFLIKLYNDHHEAHTIKEMNDSTDIELTTDHITLMAFGYNPWYLIPGLIFKMIEVKGKSIKDKWMFLRLVLL